jgi:hypothetical protein
MRKSKLEPLGRATALPLLAPKRHRCESAMSLQTEILMLSFGYALLGLLLLLAQCKATSGVGGKADLPVERRTSHFDPKRTSPSPSVFLL